MSRLMWIIALVLGLSWSGLSWMLFRLAGAGGATVVAITRWLEIEPSTTQWLADGLDLAGGVVQLLVVLVWLVGLSVMGICLWLVRKIGVVASEANPRTDVAYGQTTVEGEIIRRDVVDESAPKS